MLELLLIGFLLVAGVGVVRILLDARRESLAGEPLGRGPSFLVRHVPPEVPRREIEPGPQT